jgi:hypothetical protein
MSALISFALSDILTYSDEIKNNTHYGKSCDWHDYFLKWKIGMAVISFFQFMIPESHTRNHKSSNGTAYKYFIKKDIFDTKESISIHPDDSHIIK